MIRIPSIDSASSSSLNYHQHIFFPRRCFSHRASLSYFFSNKCLFDSHNFYFFLTLLPNSFFHLFIRKKKILHTSMFSFVEGTEEKKVKKFLWHHFFMLIPCLFDTSLILIKDSTIFNEYKRRRR